MLTGDKLTSKNLTENFGKEKNRLSPTDIGMVVNDYLETQFKPIMDYNFTANVEKEFDRVADGLTKILTRHSNYADFQLTRTSGTQYIDKDGTGGGPVKIRTIVGMYFSAARSEAYEKHGNRIEFSVKDTAGKKRKVSLTPIRTTFTEYVW